MQEAWSGGGVLVRAVVCPVARGAAGRAADPARVRGRWQLPLREGGGGYPGGRPGGRRPGERRGGGPIGRVYVAVGSSLLGCQSTFAVLSFEQALCGACQ